MRKESMSSQNSVVLQENDWTLSFKDFTKTATFSKNEAIFGFLGRVTRVKTVSNTEARSW